MNYLSIVNQISILFFIIGIGFIVGKLKIITNELNVGLSKVLLNVTLPFLIISAFNFDFSKDMLKTSGIILVISIIVHGGLALISLLLYKKEEKSIKTILRFITIFSNCGFIGYPVAESIYGGEGVFYTAIYNVGYNLFVWTLGILMFQTEKEKGLYKRVFLNPGIISVAIGMVLFIFSIKLPYAIAHTIDLIGGITIPLSMLIVGISICSVNLKSAFREIMYYYASFIRLIATPILVYVVLYFIGFREIALGIPVIVSAMPAASNTVPFAQIYNGNVDCASKITVVSTIFAMFTLPIILLLL